MTAGRSIARNEGHMPRLVRVRFENGAFTPLEPLELDEGVVVELTVIEDSAIESSSEGLDGEERGRKRLR